MTGDTTQQQQPSRRSTSSAFSRLANLAQLSSSSSTSSSPSAATPVSPSSTSVSVVASPTTPGTTTAGGPSSSSTTSVPSTSSSGTQVSGRGGALDALETIVQAANQDGNSIEAGGGGGGDRQRFSSQDSSSAMITNGGGGGTRFKRASWRDSSNSRSRERERERERERSDSSGFQFSSSNYSNSSSSPFRASHFFQPGAGSSGFSFEQQQQQQYSSSSFSVGYWDGSYRSSITGSPSLFGGGASSSTRYNPWSSSNNNSNLSVTSGGGGGDPPSSSSASSAHLRRENSSSLSRAQSPSNVLNLSRSSSPLGGGRKLKEFSRGMSYDLITKKSSTSSTSTLSSSTTTTISTSSSSSPPSASTAAAAVVEKGLVGLAKPPKNGIVNNELGRVAVAGKYSLKILKVPHGPFTSSSYSTTSTTRRPPTNPSSYAHVARSSSIADRRSRSRGSRQGQAAGGSSSGSAGSSGFVGIRDTSTDRDRQEEEGRGEEEKDNNSNNSESEFQKIQELQDVRIGSRLNSSYLFTDLRWGYGATSSKLATACNNGAVILWDLNRDSSTSKLDQVKYEHDRAVNRIVFGGQTGNWLMSGGQDGQMKLWDIRESRPSSMILKASSPVRHLSFSPSASQPFTLLAACASGTLIRYDVRYISRQNGGATDRIAGHIGSCLAMDWRDGFDCEKLPGSSSNNAGGGNIGVSQETAGGGKEGGWVVTGGIDQTIKIWDFSLPILATKPIRTLYPSQPVQSVSWHPTNGTELASSPLPSLTSTSLDKGDDSIANSAKHRSWIAGGGAQGGGGGSWKNEISIWDTRRPYFPKLSIRTDEPTSAILFNDDETIWSTSKTSTTFNQYDTASDSYSLLDCIDRPSTAWNLEGDFMFVDDSRTAHDIPFERSNRAKVPVSSDKFVPDVHLASVIDLDPDFSTESFTQLANNLQLIGDFDEICEHNTHVSFLAGRPDAAQVWAVLKSWFGKSPLSTPDTPPTTPPTGEEDIEGKTAHDTEDRASSPPLASAPDWILSPTSTTYSDAASKSNRHHRFSLSSMRSSPSSRRQTSGDTFDSSTTALPPKESIKQILDTFSEESTASETDPSAQSPYYPELSSTSSDSDEPDSRAESRRLHKASVASLPTNRLAASLAALADSKQHGLPSELSLDDLHRHSSRTPSRLASRRNSSSSSSSSASSSNDSESSSLDDKNNPKPRKSSRSAKIAALHASLIANRSRRPSAGQSHEQRPLRSRDSSTLAGRKGSRKHSAEGNSDSRRGSAARMVTNRTTSTSGFAVGGSGAGTKRKDAEKEEKEVTSKDLGRQASVAHADQAFEIVKEQLKTTLIDYADRGDSQLCAVVCCVLQGQDLGFDSLWVARVTKAYLDMLRNLDLHVPAATLNKYCSTEYLRALTQDSVVFHTACGRCGKGVEQAPYDYCQKCRMIITRCGICHLTVTSLYLFCACCGHGLHEECLQNFAGSHSISQPQTPNTVPSTPGIATPLRHWLFREGSSVVDSEDEEGLGTDAAERLAILLSHSSNSQLAGYAGASTEQYRTGYEVSRHRSYSTPSSIMSPQCACTDCHHQQAPMPELFPLRQPQPASSMNPYFPSQNSYTSIVPPTPFYFQESATSTPYDYPDQNSNLYTPSQPLHRPSSSSFYSYDTPSGTTTPLPTPPTQSRCYIPSSTFIPPESSRLQKRPKSFSLPNPAPLLTPPSYETSSVSQPVPNSPQHLAPPVKSTSLDANFAVRRRNDSSSSMEAPAVRRRSSTLSNLSIPSGPNSSDTSDGGDTSERHETITPFVTKLVALLRENSPWLRWNAEGTAFFFAHHRHEFGDQLSRAFRHGSSHSFVRQLNIYNFKRLTPAEQEHAIATVQLPSGLVPTDFAAFQHPLFFRGEACNLAKIKPKTPRKIPSKAGLKNSSGKAPSPRSLRNEGKIGGAVKTKF
ncbi:hypothetical protein JCM3765_004517 [Sporobolomyces pararoseus]